MFNIKSRSLHFSSSSARNTIFNDCRESKLGTMPAFAISIVIAYYTTWFQAIVLPE